MLGAFFFLGVIVTMIPVPKLADAYGRYWVFFWTIIVGIIAAAGLIFSNTIEEAYFFMFLNGATFSGKVIVGLSYFIEFW